LKILEGLKQKVDIFVGTNTYLTQFLNTTFVYIIFRKGEMMFLQPVFDNFISHTHIMFLFFLFIILVFIL